MEILPIVKGLATFIPGTRRFQILRGKGRTESAKYCYYVWIKHLTLLWHNGVREIPSSIGEVGPGGSLGVGLAAMLSGVNHYYALDVVKYSNPEENLKMLGELVDLFKSRTSRTPGGWPDIDEYLDVNHFPSHILTDKYLSNSLSDERIDSIRDAIKKSASDDKKLTIDHIAPWTDSTAIENDSIDLIISQSVMEHVNDLETAYDAMKVWIRPGGVMSHQIDLSSHNLTKLWNGHRQYPDFIWKIIVGRKSYLINREPCSRHLSLIEENGFKVLCCMKRYDDSGMGKSRLSSKWQDISDDDLDCRGLFVQAIK